MDEGAGDTAAHAAGLCKGHAVGIAAGEEGRGGALSHAPSKPGRRSASLLLRRSLVGDSSAEAGRNQMILSDREKKFVKQNDCAYAAG